MHQQEVRPRKLLAFSDIHGRYDAFRKLFQEDFLRNGYKLVLMGDYFGYGGQSIPLVKYIMYLKKKYPSQVYPLYGNWEDIIYMCLYGRKKHLRDICMKIVYSKKWGDELEKICFDKEMCSIIKEFPHTLDMAFSDGSYCFSHSGVNVALAKTGLPIKDIVKGSSSEQLLWNFDFAKQMKDVKTPYTFVVGHNPVQCLSKEASVRPFVSGNVIDIDMGASRKKGFLGCIRFDENGNRTFAKIPSVP